MTLTGKMFGLTTAAVFGTLIFLAPGLVTGDGDTLTTGSLPVRKALAEPVQVSPKLSRIVKAAWNERSNAERAFINHGETPETIARLEAADTAYFEAVIALEVAETNAKQIARIETADNEYFAAVMALELAGQTPSRIARLEAADTDYFNAALKIEGAEQTVAQLAELKREKAMRDTMIAFARQKKPLRIAQQAEMPKSDGIVTGSIPKTETLRSTPKVATTGSILADKPEKPKDPMSIELDKLKNADDAYFEAVIALETEGENPKDLDRLKKADDAYFEAVLAIESLQAELAAKKKTKVASAAAIVPVAPAAKKAVEPAPVQQVTHKQTYHKRPKVKSYKKVYRKPHVHKKYHAKKHRTRKHVSHERKGPLRRIVGGLFGKRRGHHGRTSYK